MWHLQPHVLVQLPVGKIWSLTVKQPTVRLGRLTVRLHQVVVNEAGAVQGVSSHFRADLHKGAGDTLCGGTFAREKAHAGRRPPLNSTPVPDRGLPAPPCGGGGVPAFARGK